MSFLSGPNKHEYLSNCRKVRCIKVNSFQGFLKKGKKRMEEHWCGREGWKDGTTKKVGRKDSETTVENFYTTAKGKY